MRAVAGNFRAFGSGPVTVGPTVALIFAMSMP